jgi:digeranylgeranylglycerophospholipid reductase
MERCDVLIVGLGPAGGAAALAAARAGLRVVAVERRRNIGRPVQCAEYVPLFLGKMAQRTGAEIQRMHGMRTVLPSGIETDSSFPGLMIDRERFDAGLAQAAREAGAEVLTGCRFLGLDREKSLAYCRDGGGEKTVAYRVLIAADGPCSPVALALGLPRLDTVLARQVVVPLNRKTARTEVFLSGDYPGGYAWLFPKGERANLGIGVERRAAGRLGGLLRALHQRMIEQGRVGETVLLRSGGAIPVGGLRPELTVGTVLFAGDAAGLTHPVTGAGIHPAVVSGEMAGKAAVTRLSGREGALKDYADEVRDLFGASLARAVRRRKEAHGSDDEAMRRSWVAFREYWGEGMG